MSSPASGLLPYQNPAYQKLLVTRVQQLANQVKVFYLEPETGGRLVYKAGQYLTFVHPTHLPEARRSYSFTSVPELNEPMAVGVKRVPNGLFSRYFYDQVKPGDSLIISGAGGMFTLPAGVENYRQVFLFAAGVGITPLFALLKEILFLHPLLKVVLVYSNSTRERTIFLDELQQLTQQFAGRFEAEFLYSNSPDLAKARLYPDLLISFLKKHATVNPSELLCYICGPLNYQRMCVYGLRRAGVPPDAIRRENFVTTEPKPLRLPPDTDEHQVTLRLGDKQIRVPVQYPETILQAARRHGLLLPYSCEAGVCGNCLARIHRGKIWLSYNEVLTEKDLANNLTLTCVGHPVGGDAEVEILK